MKSNNRNERKKYVLALLNNMNTPYTAKEIHDLCYPISLSSICASLKKYYTQGLLERKKNSDKKFIYNITENGIKRLGYLIGDTSIKSQTELLVREPVKKIRKEIRLLAREKIRL